MNHEQRVQFKRRTIFHEFSASEDDEVVRDEHDPGLLNSRHGGHTTGELKLARGIAQHIFERLVEDGP